MPQLQVTLDHALDRAIRTEAHLRHLSLSAYTRQLLVQALRDAGVNVNYNRVPKEQFPLIEVENE